MAAAPEIIAEDLHRSFGDQAVLRGLSFTIPAGELLCIVGTSGSGKTVLLNHLSGLLAPDQGRVLVADHDQARPPEPPPMRDLAKISEDELDRIRLHWAVVFQKNALFSGTVESNITLWLREHTKDSAPQILERVRASLAAVALDVDEVLPKQREQLSGGMAKRVAIARAIAVDPIVIFYDEPTTGLDPVVGAHVHDLIWATHNSPRADGIPRTTVIVTHDKDLLRRLRPRVIMLDMGQAVFDGPYDRFKASTVDAARLYLQAMPVLHARHAD